jgi:hypothetical protein
MYMRQKQKGRPDVKGIRNVDVCGHVVDFSIRQTLCNPTAWTVFND